MRKAVLTSGRMPGLSGRGIDAAIAWPGVVVAGLSVSSARMRCTVVVELEVRSADEWAEEANVRGCMRRSLTSRKVGAPVGDKAGTEYCGQKTPRSEEGAET